jgi:parallel beta-helix repeat protein
MIKIIFGFVLLIASPAFAQTCESTPNADYGPRSTEARPANAVDILPGASIQSAVKANAAGTVFWLRRGVHPITAPITPKSGMSFIGEYGACLDGSSWTTSAPDYYAAIMAHMQDIDNVTIRNLVIRDMPQRAIHGYPSYSDGWVIEHNEIAYNRSGVGIPNGAIVRRNYIHHNNGDSQGGLIANGAYIAGYGVRDLLIEHNEFAYNGAIQKILGAQRVTFRNNYLHHNGNGIWFDGDNVDIVIEDNTLDDNTGEGIWHEVGGRAVIRNNIVRRSGVSCIFLSTSRDVEVYGNTCDSNWRGINLFWSCQTSNGYAGDIGHDLRNNRVHDNTIIVGTRSDSIASSLTVDGRCTSTQAAPYLTNTKANVFARNRYATPTDDGWWHWNAPKSWTQWQAIPQDVDSSSEQSGAGPVPPPNVRLVL